MWKCEHLFKYNFFFISNGMSIRNYISFNRQQMAYWRSLFLYLYVVISCIRMWSSCSMSVNFCQYPFLRVFLIMVTLFMFYLTSNNAIVIGDTLNYMTPLSVSYGIIYTMPIPCIIAYVVSPKICKHQPVRIVFEKCVSTISTGVLFIQKLE